MFNNGSGNTAKWFIVMLGAVIVSLLVTMAAPIIMQSRLDMQLAEAIGVIKDNGYVAYGAPDGTWTTTGDLNTQDVYPQSDSSYDLGTSANRYRAGYFDSANVTTLYAPTGRSAITIAASNSPDYLKAQADYVCTGQSTLVATITGANITGSPVTFTTGRTDAQSFTITGAGSFTVTVAAGQVAVVSGTGISTFPSSKTCNAGDTTVTATGASTAYISGMGDEAVINAAISAATTGGRVHCYEGTYNCLNKIFLNKDSILEGDGDGTAITHGVTIFKLGNNVNRQLVVEVYANNIRCQDFMVDGNYTNNTVCTTTSGFYIEGYNCGFYRCGAINCRYAGVNIVADSYSNVFNQFYSELNYTVGWIVSGAVNTFMACSGSSNTAITNGSDGWWVTGSAALYNNFVSVAANSNSRNGFTFANGAAYNTISRLSTMACRQYGLYINGASHNSVLGGNIISPGQRTTNTYSAIYLDSYSGTPSTFNRVKNMEIAVIAAKGTNQYKYAFEEADTDQNDNEFSGCTILNAGTANLMIKGSRTKSLLHTNYISPGEIRTYTASYTSGSDHHGAIMTSLDNPFGQAVRIMKVSIELTTQAGAAATLDVGLSTANNDDPATKLFTALPLNPGTTYPYLYNSISNGLGGTSQGTQTDDVYWNTGATTRYLNFFNPSGASDSGAVFVYTVTVMGN